MAFSRPCVKSSFLLRTSEHLSQERRAYATASTTNRRFQPESGFGRVSDRHRLAESALIGEFNYEWICTGVRIDLFRELKNQLRLLSSGEMERKRCPFEFDKSYLVESGSGD